MNTLSTQIYDAAAAVWRKVTVESVSVRWIDLGTRLVLRHVVRVVGAEAETVGSSNRNNDDDDDQNTHHNSNSKSEGDNQKSHDNRNKDQGGGGTGDGDGEGREESGDGSRDTVEVDLNEIRWAEWTGGERQQSESQAKKLAGKLSVVSYRTEQ